MHTLNDHHVVRKADNPEYLGFIKRIQGSVFMRRVNNLIGVPHNLTLRP